MQLQDFENRSNEPQNEEESPNSESPSGLEVRREKSLNTLIEKLKLDVEIKTKEIETKNNYITVLLNTQPKVNLICRDLKQMLAN